MCEFYGRFFIKLDYPGGSFEPEYKCSKCRSILERINYDFTHGYDAEDKHEILASLPCPKCGRNALYVDTVTMVMWD